MPAFPLNLAKDLTEQWVYFGKFRCLKDLLSVLDYFKMEKNEIDRMKSLAIEARRHHVQMLKSL